MAYMPSYSSHDAPARSPPARRATPKHRLLGKVLATIRLWRQRITEREVLARLSEIEMRDLRFSRSEIAHEIRKPFWRE